MAGVFEDVFGGVLLAPAVAETEAVGICVSEGVHEDSTPFTLWARVTLNEFEIYEKVSAINRLYNPILEYNTETS
jgi:hypothetical protein